MQLDEWSIEPTSPLAAEWLVVADEHIARTLTRRDAVRYARRCAATLALTADDAGLSAPTRAVLAAEMRATTRSASRWSGWMAEQGLVEVASIGDGSATVYRLTRPIA